MSSTAIEMRLDTVSRLSPLGFHSAVRVDMSPAAIEARLEEWAELTALCLELATGSSKLRG
jgi:hypothetical protein